MAIKVNSTNETGFIQARVEEKSVSKSQAPILAKLTNPLQQREFAKALGGVIPADKFMRLCVTAYNSNADFSRCAPASFIQAAMQAAQCGLEPNTVTGEAYLIPFHNGKKNIDEVQFQLGYKGLIKLAYRTGEIASIEARTVYENDEFVYELGLDTKLRHKPFLNGERGEAIAYYAIVRLKNGGYNFEVMTKTDVIAFAKVKSKTFSFGPWKTDFDAMAKKTVLKQALKYVPIASDVASQIASEDAEDLNETMASALLGDQSSTSGKVELDGAISVDTDGVIVPPVSEQQD